MKKIIFILILVLLFASIISIAEDTQYAENYAVDAVEPGFGGYVTTHVELSEDGTINRLVIDTPNETEGLGTRASEEAFTAQFIGKSGPFAYGENGIEALTGATITSEAALRAINKALNNEKYTGITAKDESVTKTEHALEIKRATEQGYGGDITVHAIIADNTIQAIAIDASFETVDFGMRASEEMFTDQFVGKSGPFVYGENGIEALTGATITSEAVLKAINKVLEVETAEQTAFVETDDHGVKETETESDEEIAEEDEKGEDEPYYYKNLVIDLTDVDANKRTEFAEEDHYAIVIAERGFGGDVMVHAELNEDGTINRLVIDTPNETEGLGTRASEEAFTAQFIGKRGPFVYGENGIEALSGATVTSRAALKAINKALEVETAVKAFSADVDGHMVAATETGFGGDVTAHVELNEDGTINRLVIDTPYETVYMGKRASEEAFTAQFIGKRGPFAYGENGIEALTGATITSEAALMAVNKAIEIDAAEKAAGNHLVVATEAGFAGDVTAHVELNKDETINSLVIDTGNDLMLPLYSDVELFVDQFIGKSGPFIWGENGIEAMTGATYTSNAVLKAINKAFEVETLVKEDNAKKDPNNATLESITYTATSDNNFSRITVIASVKEGKLDDVRILSEGDENIDLLTDEVKNVWAKAILESGSAEPDVITGATLRFSAASVIDAMQTILAQINKASK